MLHQLAIEVVEVKAFGDEGSGGSTPLLMTTGDGTKIFGKILATSHVRSDRWYRIMRTILYGQLEDEAPFGSVRRLIGYEDYALRLLDDDRIRVARSYGIVELTPNAEYLLPTEFFDESQTLGHAEVNGEIVDQAMALVRTLWDQGLAHRDIKPANLLVVDGRLQLIDVSGLEVRPSPWRQAVDLANMMLVMALRTDSRRVYHSALRYFSPEEVGEAFACAQGLAIPTELQRYLKQDPRDLIGEFKELAPPFPKVSIQRWTGTRIALTVGAVLGVILVIDAVVQVIHVGVA
jgi:serine/threonine protein kinase